MSVRIETSGELQRGVKSFVLKFRKAGGSKR